MIKIKQRALATLLALTIPLNLAGCKDTNTKQKAGAQEQTTDASLNPTPKGQITQKEVEITEFLKRMSEIRPLYNLEDLYFTQEELTEIDEIANSIQTCDYKETDYSNLAETIIENSIPPMPKRLSTVNKSEYVELLEKNLQRAIDIAFSTSSNVNEDICLLRTLKIVPVDLSGTGSYVLYDYETNTVSLDYKLVFKEMEEQNGRATSLNALGSDPLYSTYSKDEFITKVYGNIINMVRERICYCRKEKGETNTTISYNRTLSHLLYVANEEQITHSQEFKEFTREGEFPNELF